MFSILYMTNMYAYVYTQYVIYSPETDFQVRLDYNLSPQEEKFLKQRRVVVDQALKKVLKHNSSCTLKKVLWKYISCEVTLTFIWNCNNDNNNQLQVYQMFFKYMSYYCVSGPTIAQVLVIYLPP